MVEKVSSTPKNPALGVLNGVAQVHRPRRRAGRHRILRPRHHHHHQRAAGDARRQGRAAHHQGLSRGAGGAEPGARRQPVRLFLRQAAADRAAEPDQGNPGALRLSPATCSCRSIATPCAAPRASSKAAGVESIAVCYLFSFMNPAHEAGDARAHPRGISRRACLAVERGAAAHPRMAAALDHAAQRLSRAGDGALHRPSQQRPRRGRRRHAAALPDAVERRRDAVLGRDRRRPHGAHAVLRPGRRRAGRRLSRRGRRARRPRHARHGRHLAPTSPSSKAACRSKPPRA